MDCLPILGMVSGCATPDLAMLRWIAYIKSLNTEIRHISGKDNAMAEMVSRARFDDEGGMVSDDEEVSVDMEALRRLTSSTRASMRRVALDRWVPEENDTGCGMDQRIGQQDSEESIPILPMGWVHMEAPEEERRHPTPGGGKERGTRGVAGGVPRKSLGWTPRDFGHVRESKGEVLVAGTILGCASVQHDLRELSDALHGPKSGRASPDLPSDRPLQLDGGSGDDVDGSRADVISGAGTGGPDEPSGRPSIAKQNDRGCVPILDRGSGMPVRVCGEDHSRPRRTGRTRG